jgi:hypothetical protein
MFYFSCADGSHSIPPFIIHTSAANSAQGLLFKNLPESWGFGWSASGYMTQDLFTGVCDEFVRYCGVTKDDPRFLYIDGHDSHFSPDAIEYLLISNVHVRILSSQNSTNDQPNDMGNKCQLKCHYSQCLAV